ncbi:MAG: HNH endonuclease, partial [Betaproteobacteria bacterium]|nr:HNH endonuclease [Betaproteobacteria bacterium]
RLDSLGALHRAVLRAYRLARALPEAPLEVFRARTADLPRTTEAERLVVKRVGQDVFREALLDYWNHRCPLTGIEDTALLRASHIVPWARCESDAMRLDAHNGLLLAAHWDAAFDAGLVSFADDGRALASPKLSAAALKALHLAAAPALAGLTDAHRANLAWHRRYRFLAGVAGASR